MRNIIKIEFWTLLLIGIATIVLLTVNAINSDKIINTDNVEIESYEKTIDSYQDKVDAMKKNYISYGQKTEITNLLLIPP